MGNMRRNLRAVTSASGFLEQLFIVTRLLNLEVPGVMVECGTYKGGSAVNFSLACELVNRRLVICDSFAGLPRPSEQDRTHSTIDGMTDDYEAGWWRGTLAEVRGNITRYGAIDRCSPRTSICPTPGSAASRPTWSRTSSAASPRGRA